LKGRTLADIASQLAHQCVNQVSSYKPMCATQQFIAVNKSKQHLQKPQQSTLLLQHLACPAAKFENH
jgi:hypothetical protein